jgi:predicted nucleic acid-binding protein
MARSQRHRRHARVREAPAARYTPGAPPAGIVGILLDSDVIIEALRGRQRVVDALLAVETAGTPTYCCAVAWAEIYAGVRRGEEVATEAFFRARGEVTIDAETGRRAGSYLARYARSHGLELADALVAAAASTAGLVLWTQNRRDYPMADVRFYAPE